MGRDPATDEVVLRNGSRLEVRPIRPDDADALVALHARLSADTIYRRYFGARPHLAAADVERFTRVDGRYRFALVADPGERPGRRRPLRGPAGGSPAPRSPSSSTTPSSTRASAG